METIEIGGVKFLKCTKRSCIWNGGYASKVEDDVRVCSFGGCDFADRRTHERSQDPVSGCIHLDDVWKLAAGEERKNSEEQRASFEAFLRKEAEDWLTFEKIGRRRKAIRTLCLSLYKEGKARQYLRIFVLLIIGIAGLVGFTMYLYLATAATYSWLFLIIPVIWGFWAYTYELWWKFQYMRVLKQYEDDRDSMLTANGEGSEMLQYFADNPEQVPYFLDISELEYMGGDLLVISSITVPASVVLKYVRRLFRL